MKIVLMLAIVATSLLSPLGSNDNNREIETNNIENQTCFSYVLDDAPIKPKQRSLSNNEIVLLGEDWNIATYSINTGMIDYEYFNENYYAQRNKSLKSSRTFELENDLEPYSTIHYSEDGNVAYTIGYTPEQSLPKTRGTIGIMGNDERIKVTNPKAYPYYTTGKVEAVWTGLKNNKDGLYYNIIGSGTGSMQGPNLLVTAGHCVYGDVTVDDFDDNKDNPTFPDYLLYYPGLNGTADKNNGIVVDASEISIDRDYYEKQSTEHDWAAIKLSTDIGYTTGWNGKMSNWYEKDHAISSFGYPGDKNEDMWLTAGSLTGKTNYIYKTNLDIVGGQSGSPLFADVDSGTYMIGIVTHSHYYWFFGDHTDYNGATRINGFIFSFLNSFVTSSRNARVETVMPQNYGFADAYPIDNATYSNYKTHTVNNFSFQTRRYRTGYIQQEYIVMSPIKTNITEAYIEYKFTNPVFRIDVELTYWRSISNEWLTSDTGKAELQVLNNNNWTRKIDLLSPETNLSQDRSQPKTYIINFTDPVTSFRFFSQINSPTTSSNNRGRICIGDMNIYTTY